MQKEDKEVIKMEKCKILYQIKSLDKMIFRSICKKKEKELIHKIMTPTQLQIIEYILEQGDKDIYQKELENILNLRRATVSEVLQTMEKNGLITRVINPEDTRSKKIILNNDTKKIFYKKLERVAKTEKKIIENIKKEDLAIFLKVILQMKRNLQVEQNEKEEKMIS